MTSPSTIPTDTHTETGVRDRLVEAAAEAYRTCPHSAPRYVGEHVLAAVLPLIAEAVESRKDFWGQPGDMALDDVAGLVRSWAGEQR